MHINIKKIHLFIIILITLLVYSNILQNRFVWDDQQFILEWKETRTFKNTLSFLEGQNAPGHHGVYRPLRSIFYAISYKLWKLNPAGYHIQSILMHLISTILIYFITLKITKNNTIAFMTSLIFGTHPIHTEAISYITASFDMMGVVFLLISFYLYLEKEGRVSYIISIISALLAFFTYEMTLTLPLLIVLYDLIFKKIRKENFLKKIKEYLPYFAIAFFYMVVRSFLINVASRGSYLGNSLYLTMLTMSKAFVKYIFLVVLPLNLTINHEISNNILSIIYPDINENAVLAQSIFDLNIIFSIILLIIIIITAFLSFKRWPLVSFSIFFFFLFIIASIKYHTAGIYFS